MTNTLAYFCNSISEAISIDEWKTLEPQCMSNFLALVANIRLV
jgi:hypothetical protein